MALRLVNFLVLAMMLGVALDALTGCGGNGVAPSPSASIAAPAIHTGAAPSGFFKVCKGQTYALCATASCMVLNQVAYCQCDVKEGDSISLPLRVDGEEVCSINANGVDNGYMVSTFSLLESVVAPYGHRALYTCPAGSTGGYAAMRRRSLLHQQQRQLVPGVRQAARQRGQHLRVPGNPDPGLTRRLPDRRALSLRRFVFPLLQQPDRQRQHGPRRSRSVPRPERPGSLPCSLTEACRS
jgi:hypothetical protein